MTNLLKCELLAQKCGNCSVFQLRSNSLKAVGTRQAIVNPPVLCSIKSPKYVKT